MKGHGTHRAQSAGQRGQALMDYVVGCALVTALLVAPFPGGRSAIELLLDGVRLGYARLVTALSVPV